MKFDKRQVLVTIKNFISYLNRNHIEVDDLNLVKKGKDFYNFHISFKAKKDLSDSIFFKRLSLEGVASDKKKKEKEIKSKKKDEVCRSEEKEIFEISESEENVDEG